MHLYLACQWTIRKWEKATWCTGRMNQEKEPNFDTELWFNSFVQCFPTNCCQKSIICRYRERNCSWNAQFRKPALCDVKKSSSISPRWSGVHSNLRGHLLFVFSNSEGAPKQCFTASCEQRAKSNPAAFTQHANQQISSLIETVVKKH